MMPTGDLLGVLAALGSGLAWALGSILFRRIGERASPAAMNLTKSVMGLGVLGIGVVATGVSAIQPGQILPLALSGVLGIAVGDTLFFAALVRLEPRVTLLLATVGNVMTVLLAALVLGERPTVLAWAGIALVIGAVGWVLQLGAETEESGAGPVRSARQIGILCGVGAAFATSSSLLIAKVAIEGVVGQPEMSVLQATWIRLFAGVVALGMFRAVQGELAGDLAAFKLPGFVKELLVAVTVVMYGGFWLSLLSLRYTDAAVATALAGTEPILVLPLLHFWLGERVRPAAWIAALVGVIGVGMIVWATG